MAFGLDDNLGIVRRYLNVTASRTPAWSAAADPRPRLPQDRGGRRERVLAPPTQPSARCSCDPREASVPCNTPSSALPGQHPSGNLRDAAWALGGRFVCRGGQGARSRRHRHIPIATVLDEYVASIRPPVARPCSKETDDAPLNIVDLARYLTERLHLQPVSGASGCWQTLMRRAWKRCHRAAAARSRFSASRRARASSMVMSSGQP